MEGRVVGGEGLSMNLGMALLDVVESSNYIFN